MIEELEKLAKETEFAAGYVRVRTPHLAREKMYLTSAGILPLLRRDHVSADGAAGETAEERRAERVEALLPQGDELPASSRIFAAVPRSYRDLPLRLAEYGTCYRYEQSRRIFRPHARALAANERRAHLLHAGAVRGRVQRGERDVSQIFQDFRPREIS